MAAYSPPRISVPFGSPTMTLEEKFKFDIYFTTYFPKSRTSVSEIIQVPDPNLVPYFKLHGGDLIGNPLNAAAVVNLIGDIPEMGDEKKSMVIDPFDMIVDDIKLRFHREIPVVQKAIVHLAFHFLYHYYRIFGDANLLLSFLDTKNFNEAYHKSIEELRNIIAPPGKIPDSTRIIMHPERERLIDLLVMEIFPALADDELEFENMHPVFRTIVETPTTGIVKESYERGLFEKNKQFTEEGLPEPSRLAGVYLAVNALELLRYMTDLPGIAEEKNEKVGFINILTASVEHFIPDTLDKTIKSAIMMGTRKALFTQEEQEYIDEYGDLYEGLADEVEVIFEHPEALFTNPNLARLRSGEYVQFEGKKHYVSGLIDKAWNVTTDAQKIKFQLDKVRYPVS